MAELHDGFKLRADIDINQNSLNNTAYLYFGDSVTNGSWRIYISSGNLVVEKRETGSWIEKGRYE